MSLEKQTVAVPIVDGLSDNDDNFASDPPGFLELIDARWSRDKQVGKRLGVQFYADVGDGQAITGAKDLNQIVDLDGVAHALTNNGTYRRNGVTNSWDLMNAGALRASRVVSDPLVRINYSCVKSDAAVVGDIVCAVWEQVDKDGPAGAFYGFWDISGDVPRPLAGPFNFNVHTSITNSVRVVGIGGRYFVATGLNGTSHGNMCVTAYDTQTGDWTFPANATLDAVNDNHYGLAEGANGASYAYLFYPKQAGPLGVVKKLSTTGAVLATLTMAVNVDAQHLVHNATLAKVVVITRGGLVYHMADSLAGAETAVTPFTNPASGRYTGRFFRATVGLADSSGNMYAARSTSGYASLLNNAPYATQIVKIDTSFVASGENLIGGCVLSAHFSPYITEDGCSYLGVAQQGAYATMDADPTVTALSQNEAYRAAPCGYVVRVTEALYQGGGYLHLATCGRYGQDAMDLLSNKSVASAGVMVATSHLPHLAYDVSAASSSKRIVTAYPVRLGDYLGGATALRKLAVDMARIQTHNTTPTRNVYAQATRLLGGGTGTGMIDGIDHVEMTPQAPEFVAFNGYDVNCYDNVWGYVLPPVAPLTYIQDHIDYTGWDVWGPALGNNPNRQWGFVIVWQYVDARGNIHRSAPSSVKWTKYTDFSNIVGPNNFGSKMVFPPWKPSAILGDKNLVVEAAVYGCPPDGNGDFRLLGIVTPLVDPADEGLVYVTIAKGAATRPKNAVMLQNWDAVDPAPRSLYTSADGGGELEHDPSPPLLSICSTQSRLWGLNGEDRLDVWYTKPLTLGLSPEWSSTLRVRIPQDGGPSVGIAALDDKVVVFKRTKVFVIEGDGGDAAGNASSLRPPRLVSSDIGCDAVESIVEGPFGVIFHSERGFFLLGRDLTYRFVGDRVMDQLTKASVDLKTRVVTSACIVPAESEIRFLTDTERGGNYGLALAWNYRLDRWTQRTTATNPKFSSTVDGVEWSVSNSGSGNTILKETPFDWALIPGVSGGKTTGMAMRSSWIKLNGIAGFGRVWRAVFVFRWYENGITIRTAQDYQAETETAKTWSAGTLTTLVDSTTHRLELAVRPTVQKCESIQFVISEELGQASGGRGFELIGVSLEVGVKKGAYKRLAAEARK